MTKFTCRVFSQEGGSGGLRGHRILESEVGTAARVSGSCQTNKVREAGLERPPPHLLGGGSPHDNTLHLIKSQWEVSPVNPAPRTMPGR